ncbi:SpoIIE family protein phosphatase [Streptomyces sp. NPDC047028]|uniref:SpoIIE family protein phosphatase n=1 Tax=Streptomyces sp. NPDC047028 TaxID=3155793 RepID=UPI0033CEDBC9
MERLPTPPSGRAQTHAVPPGAFTATATVDERGVVTGWSDGARLLLGYPPAEIIGRPAAQLLADPGTPAPTWPEAAARERWGGTLALRHRAGHRLVERHVLAHRRPARDGTGGEWLIVSAVTGPRRVDGGRELGERAFDRAPCALAVFDRDLRLVRASAGLERALSVTREAMYGLRLPDLVPHPASDDAETRMRRVLQDGARADVPLCLDTGDARRLPAELIPLEDADGRVLAVCVLAHPAAPQSQEPASPGATAPGPRAAGSPPTDTSAPGVPDPAALATDSPAAEVPAPAAQAGGASQAGRPSAPDFPAAPSTGTGSPPTAAQAPASQAGGPSPVAGPPADVPPATAFPAPGSPAPGGPPPDALLPASLVRRRMRVLSRAGTGIGTTSDVRRTAQELAEVAVPEFADTCVVDLLDTPRHGEPPGAWSTAGVTLRRAAAGTGPDASHPPRPAGETLHCAAWSPPARCLATGQGALYGGGEEALARWAREDPQAAWIRDGGTHSLLVVPVRAAGTTLGTAVFARHERQEPFDADDLWLAGELAAKAATSVRETDRAPRSHTTTMTLQRSLLPQTLPEQGAVDLATRYLPAVGQAGVGGDWFDVIPLSGTRVALVVGDVVGHGIRASATMGRVRTAVRTLADVDLPPDELLSHLDDLVIHLSAVEADADAEAAGGVGTTCLYAVYDPVSRQCALARAGHPPPAVVTPDGDVRLLDVPAGPPLGLGGLPFEAFETELPEGSLLALYTDGLLEGRDHDIDEALDRMFAALGRPAQSLDTVCDRVLTSMLSRRPEDDIALLVARTHALHADRVASWELPFDTAVVSEARQRATDQLAAWQLDEAAFVTELVVSELVTNAIRYGRPPARLRLIHDDRTLTCEVFDSSNTAPHMRRARTFDEGGRGLLLVGQLAQRWGTRHTTRGKTVWAEQFLTAKG